jgi:6,7-dimethyl-8-ribityllumazine synthase
VSEAAKSAGVSPEPLDGSGLDIAVIVARFNREVTERLLEACTQALAGCGARHVVHWVPGAMEIGVVAMRLAGSGDYDAVICLGAVIRGETPHFEHVSSAAVEAVSRVSLATGVPAIMGILTTDDVPQAMARAGGDHGNKGEEAALTAVEMALLMKKVGRSLRPLGFQRQLEKAP